MQNNEETKYSYRICPACTFFCNSLEKDKFCSSCGTELIDCCTNCGKEITNPYAKHCKHCGHTYRRIEDNSGKIKF